MPELRIKRTDDGYIKVTPQSAGWTYVGFEVGQLSPGETVGENTGERELCLVFVAGKGRVTVGGKDFGELGKRMSPFDGPPSAVYVPAAHRLVASPQRPRWILRAAPRRVADYAAAHHRRPAADHARQGQQHALRHQHPARDRRRRIRCWWSR